MKKMKWASYEARIEYLERHRKTYRSLHPVNMIFILADELEVQIGLYTIDFSANGLTECIETEVASRWFVEVE